MKDKKQDYSVSEVAEIFGCDVQTVRNLIMRGKIRAYRLGGLPKRTKSPGRKAEFRIPWAEVERVRAEWMYQPEPVEESQ